MKTSTLFIAIFCFVFGISCKEKTHTNVVHFIRADMRFGGIYYSIYALKTGTLFVEKGRCSNSAAAFRAFTKKNSIIVKSDSVLVFYKKISYLQQHPILVQSSTTDSPRTEIYIDNKKVYDSYSINSQLWELFEPIVDILPSGYSPFASNQHPFE